jgi:hypothetical protein
MIFKLINSNKCHIQMTSSSYVIYLLIKSSAQLAGSSINIKSLANKMHFEVYWVSLLEFNGKQI